jgi:hypothetical protein
VAGPLSNLLARRDVPQADRPVPAAGGQDRAARGHGDAGNGPAVSFQSVQLPTSGSFPDVYRAVLARGRQRLPVPGGGHGQDGVLVPRQAPEFARRRGLPEPDGAVMTAGE